MTNACIVFFYQFRLASLRIPNARIVSISQIQPAALKKPAQRTSPLQIIVPKKESHKTKPIENSNIVSNTKRRPKPLPQRRTAVKFVLTPARNVPPEPSRDQRCRASNLRFEPWQSLCDRKTLKVFRLAAWTPVLHERQQLAAGTACPARKEFGGGVENNNRRGRWGDGREAP